MGSTLHVLQAIEIAAEDWDGETLRVSLRPVAKKNGAVYFSGEDGVRKVEVELTAERTIEV